MYKAMYLLLVTSILKEQIGVVIFL